MLFINSIHVLLTPPPLTGTTGTRRSFDKLPAPPASPRGLGVFYDYRDSYGLRRPATACLLPSRRDVRGCHHPHKSSGWIHVIYNIASAIPSPTTECSISPPPAHQTTNLRMAANMAAPPRCEFTQVRWVASPSHQQFLSTPPIPA